MRRLAVAGALVALMVTLGAAPLAAGPTAGLETFCQARVDIEKAFIEAPFGNGEPDPEAVEEFQNLLFPLLDQADQNAPPEIASQVTTVTAALRQAAQTGEDPFEDPAIQQASQAVNQYVIANCGFETVEVTGLEYEFEGIPKTVKAGVVAFDFTNEGAEIHELVIFRIKGKDSLKKILDLPEKKAEKKIEFVGATFVPQDASDATILELEPGRYGAVCFIPVGTTDPEALEDEEGEGKAAFEEGMYKEFKVKR